MSRGYFGIGIYHTKSEVNVGTLWRSAFNMGAAFIFTIGRRYKRQSSDTTESWRHIPLLHYQDFAAFQEARPYDCLLIGIEQCAVSAPLHSAGHPERAIYLLGAEDHGIPQDVLNKCQRVYAIESARCLNVAVAGSIVMYDRAAKLACAKRSVAA